MEHGGGNSGYCKPHGSGKGGGIDARGTVWGGEGGRGWTGMRVCSPARWAWTEHAVTGSSWGYDLPLPTAVVVHVVMGHSYIMARCAPLAGSRIGEGRGGSPTCNCAGRPDWTAWPDAVTCW